MVIIFMEIVCRLEIESAMYFRKKTAGGRDYLQIVESRREVDKVRQQVIVKRGHTVRDGRTRNCQLKTS
jgi:hypothetical protein